VKVPAHQSPPYLILIFLLDPNDFFWCLFQHVDKRRIINITVVAAVSLSSGGSMLDALRGPHDELCCVLPAAKGQSDPVQRSNFFKSALVVVLASSSSMFRLALAESAFVTMYRSE